MLECFFYWRPVSKVILVVKMLYSEKIKSEEEVGSNIPGPFQRQRHHSSCPWASSWERNSWPLGMNYKEFKLLANNYEGPANRHLGISASVIWHKKVRNSAKLKLSYIITDGCKYLKRPDISFITYNNRLTLLNMRNQQLPIKGASRVMG